MFDWMKSEESVKNDFKILIDDCGDKLDLSLQFYYKNYFINNVSNTRTNKTGIERFYLFMCVAFGYLNTSLNKLHSHEGLVKYFIEYIPLRLVKKFDQKIGLEVFEGFDFGLTNIDGVSKSFGYAGAMITGNRCPLSDSAARTGGHMINSYQKNSAIIQADEDYAQFRKMRTLFRDGDRVLQGLQLVFDNKNLEMHKLDIRN